MQTLLRYLCAKNCRQTDRWLFSFIIVHGLHYWWVNVTASSSQNDLTRLWDREVATGHCTTLQDEGDANKQSHVNWAWNWHLLCMWSDNKYWGSIIGNLYMYCSFSVHSWRRNCLTWLKFEWHRNEKLMTKYGENLKLKGYV